jgi:hypothetical protein
LTLLRAPPVALSRSGVFAVAGDSSSAPQIHLRVYRLGMHRPMGMTSDLKPIIGIEASLVDDGAVLWKRRELTANLSEQTRQLLLR